MKTLSTLISLVEKKLEEKQKQIALIEQEQERIQAERRKLQQSAVQGFNKAAKASSEHAMYQNAGPYADRAKDRDKELQAVEALVAEQHKKVRAELKDLFAEKKRLEIIADQKAEELAKKIAKKNQGELDEIAGQKKK